MYKIVIENDRYKSLKWAQTFILLLNGIAFFAFGFFRSEPFLMGWSIVIGVSILLIWNEKKLNNFKLFKKSNFASSGLIWTLFGWIFIGNWIMGGVILLLLVIQFSLKKKFEILFSDHQIHIPLFRKRNFLWYELQNVVLKDGLLTIDFKNNRLIQNQILFEESNVVTEEGFNDYCQKQLSTRYN